MSLTLSNLDPILSIPIIHKKGFCNDLFSWKELANLINIRPLMTPDRVQLLDPKERKFQWMATGWNLNPNCYPPSLIKTLLDEIVIYFIDMSRATKKINDFANSIEQEYKRQTDAHIYVCRRPELEHPFGCHLDSSHNIIVQCEGKTNFKVWNKLDNAEELIKNVKNCKLKIKEKPVLDVVMEKGDAIWIPLHCPHEARSLTPRLSVSFPFTNHGLLENANEDRSWIEL